MQWLHQWLGSVQANQGYWRRQGFASRLDVGGSDGVLNPGAGQASI